MGALFAISRPNGKSNTEILIEVFRDGKPGDTFSYEMLGEVLSFGSRRFDRADVRRAVTTAYRPILQELQRALRSVRNVGYELIAASDHRALAVERKRRSDRQLHRGLLALQHVRRNEMGAEANLSHDQLLIAVGALWQQQQGFEQRLRRIEELIDKGGR